MKLTGRQRAFLGKFLDLYREVQAPLHYSDVAEAFGVAKNTAYGMLRVLEKRGLVHSVRAKGQGTSRPVSLTKRWYWMLVTSYLSMKKASRKTRRRGPSSTSAASLPMMNAHAGTSTTQLPRA